MTVTIYSDFLCPWCYIGKRRIATALASVPDGKRPSIDWRSYQLAPDKDDVPGATAAEEMRGWYGEDQAHARIERIRALGAAEGIELNLHLARPVSSFNAHRLHKRAISRGLGEEMSERLFRAYHTEGLNIADTHVLERLGTEAGLERDEVVSLLSGTAYIDEIEADARDAARLGVRSVPSLLIDEKPVGSAVQDPAALRQMLTLATG